MRWIVITLIAINIAYFAWQQLSMPTPTPTVSSQTATNNSLRLASEMRAVTPAVEEPQRLPEQSDQPQSAESLPVETPELPAPVKVTPPSIKTCYSVGPFSLMDDVRSASRMFEREKGIETQQRAAGERSQAGYWVYVPPFDNLSAARAVLRDLQNRDIRDVLVISEGAKANSISAGVYNVEAQAEERRDSIRVHGYKAEIEALFRTQPQYWLDVELIDMPKIPRVLWSNVTKRFTNIKRTERKCE